MCISALQNVFHVVCVGTGFVNSLDLDCLVCLGALCFTKGALEIISSKI